MGDNRINCRTLLSRIQIITVLKASIYLKIYMTILVKFLPLPALKRIGKLKLVITCVAFANCSFYLMKASANNDIDSDCTFLNWETRNRLLKDPEQNYIFSKYSWNLMKNIILIIFCRVAWDYLNNCLHICVFMYVCF